MCVFLLFICVFVLVEGGFWSKKTGTVFHVAETVFWGDGFRKGVIWLAEGYEGNVMGNFSCSK